MIRLQRAEEAAAAANSTTCSWCEELRSRMATARVEVALEASAARDALQQEAAAVAAAVELNETVATAVSVSGARLGAMAEDAKIAFDAAVDDWAWLGNWRNLCIFIAFLLVPAYLIVATMATGGMQLHDSPRVRCVSTQTRLHASLVRYITAT